MREAVLVLTPPPTPNGPLHVGHLSGPYVAGDIAARALRAAGRDVITQSGLDEHQNYVLTRAEARGEPAADTVAHFAELIEGGFAAARIRYDLMLRPMTDTGYHDAVRRLLSELVEAKSVEVGPFALSGCGGCGRVLHHARVCGLCPTCGAGAAGGTCEGCGGFCTAATLRRARSTCCDAEPVPVEHTVPVLRLEEHRDRLCEFWSRAVLPPRLRALIASMLDAGLPDVPLAYPTDWGIAWGDGLRVDVWAEMALANLYAPARHLDPGVRTLADCVRAWRGITEQWLFLGIDNAFYYAVLIPALHLVAGLPAGLTTGPTGLVVNEFYRLTGSKFSTSRQHAIWAHEFLATEDAGAVRAFVSWDRPDRYESDFTPTAFAAFREMFAQALDGRLPGVPAALADLELQRAMDALRPATFDSALAVRCALAAAQARPDLTRAVLGLVAGVD
jgi:methionyl-tRNA synthetase